MDINPDEVVTVRLGCGRWSMPYTREITLQHLGELLLQLDDMAAATAAEKEDAA
ncbi:hypothetical protein ACWDZ4_04835 [Streptomyces sp. NPDC003016]